MVDYAVKSITIERNIQSLYTLGSSNPVAYTPGYEEIKASVTAYNLTEKELDDMDNSIDKELNIYYKKFNGEEWLLKGCVITAYDINTNMGEPYIAEFDVLVKEYRPSKIIIKFKDGDKEVNYLIYETVLNEYKNLNNMTYEEFKEHYMVTQI